MTVSRAHYPDVIFLLTAVESEIKSSLIADKESAYKGYLSSVSGKSNSEAREIAEDILGKPIFWDWDRE